MSDFVIPAIYAALVWWFTTGIILFLDGLPRPTFRWSMLGATVALLAAFWVLGSSAFDPSPAGAYAAFTASIVIWGWLEMGFLMGYITGPRKHACPERCAGWPHFVHATQAIIYIELTTLAGAIAVLLATWTAPNRVALWTYLVLWVMRLSAKFNLFLGVPNLGERFLPAHLRYLSSFFTRRAMNYLFPLSIALSAAATFDLAHRFLTADGPFHATGYALTCSLLGLAVIEHAFMVLPLPSERLWSWAAPRSHSHEGETWQPQGLPIEGRRGMASECAVAGTDETISD